MSNGDDFMGRGRILSTLPLIFVSKINITEVMHFKFYFLIADFKLVI